MGVKRHKGEVLFYAVAFLVIAQIIWWMMAFFDNVSMIKLERLKNLELRSSLETVDVTAEKNRIEELSRRRRLMFWSESITFLMLTGLGLFLLYRALKIESKSRETQRNFIETVTHESKTPMTAIKLRLENLQEQHSGEKELAQQLGLISTEVRRLTSIFEKTLTLNRSERHALSPEPIRVVEVLQQLERRLEPFLKDQNADLVIQASDECTVIADLQAFQNAIQSLIENAVLYNGESLKQVRIEAHDFNGRVQLNITDNGPGIDSSDRAKIFERFYRGRSGRKSAEVPGTGLGLYLAKTLIEAQQGHLTLVGSDKGAHFQIVLPQGEIV